MAQVLQSPFQPYLPNTRELLSTFMVCHKTFINRTLVINVVRKLFSTVVKSMAQKRAVHQASLHAGLELLPFLLNKYIFSFAMAPKSKPGDKGKGKESGVEKGGGKQKGAQSINVRHILCEKHSKKEEALAKLNAGSKFDEVAREFSEDKARQGTDLGNEVFVDNTDSMQRRITWVEIQRLSPTGL